MVPRVTCPVMRRGWKHTIGVRGLPVRLSLKVGAVARRTVVRIQALPCNNVAVIPVVISSGCGGQRQQDWDHPPHATFTHVRIPPTAWLSMWQCSNQRPGLSKTHMTSRLSPAFTRVVSRRSPKAPFSSTS